MTPGIATRPVCRFFLICLFLIGAMALPELVKAGNFPVTNGNNAGAGSLRQAILDANAAGPGPHTITFTVSGTINITTPLPAITVTGVTIDGANAITVNAGGGDIDRDIFTISASSTTLKGMTLQNSGSDPIQLNGNLNMVRIEDIIIRHTVNDWINHGIYVGGNSTNMTIKNVTITDVQSAYWGMRFVGNVTNLMVDNYRTFNGSGNAGRGIQIQGVANGVTIKNSLLDLNSPVSADDGDYGVYFNTTASNVNIDSCTFHDTEVYGVYFGAGASNIQIKHSKFDNLNGWTANKMIFFNSNVNGVNIDSVDINLDLNGTTDDGDDAIWFNANMKSVTIQKSYFKEIDADAIYAINGLDNDNITITKNVFEKIGSGGAHAGVHLTTVRNTTSDNGQVLISDNTFRDINGVGIYVRPNNTTSYIIPNLVIRNNIITGCKVYGGIKVNYIDKIIITQNSIYNNAGNGIDLTDNSAANCAYEGANKPQLLSSAETTPGSGIYTVQVKMPSICGTNGCSLELFSNEAGVKGIGGQHYVQTFTGLGQGTRTLTNVTGAFAEITGAPYGTWTATLRAAANCGTSEFSNKIPVKVNGPAGVSLGIKLWLRGDDISVNGSEPTADGQVITGWEEFSGGGGPSATTVINNPVVRLGRINFNPVADMDADGIRGHLPNAPSWITTNATTTVAVFNPLSITASGDRFFCLFSQAGNDANVNQAQIEFYRTGNNINAYRGSTLLNPAIPGLTGVSAFDRPGVFSSITTGTNHSYNYNGAGMGSGNYSKGNFAISQWFIGTGWNSTNGWSSQSETDFAEVFTYNRTLTALELQKVQSYMALKYGIAMKQNYVLSNGTQVWDVTANATYSKEIAALVKDNLSILHQKQARAFHTEEPISIGLGSALAVTNKDNDGEITNDLSVLMWGNDSATTSFTTNFTAGTYSNTRMTRVWKVQKTNWADQDITIQLKNGKDNNYLLISTDPTFATGVQELKMTKTGTITISSSLLANGIYFTFGREQKMPGGVLNGLSVWVKADMGVSLSGTNAVTWEDQAPAMRVWNKVNTIALNWNNTAMNYNPAIVFPGSTNANYFSVSPQFTNTFTQGEVFSVQSSAVNNVAGFPYQLGGTSGTTTLFYRYTDNNMYLHWGTNARRQFLYGAKNMALPVILNVNTLTNSWTASLDGKVMSGPAAYTTSFAQQGTNNAIGVAYGSYFNGPISEVILYNRKLNSTERQQLNSYMALKYGITLDQTTPTSYLASDGVTTMWNAANNTGYTSNIAGIGRDENGSLYQKQSRSINTASNGNLIAVAVGDELALSNADNVDSIENDKSFLVWGDNNGAITYSTIVTAGGKVTQRMPRVWKTDKTNWNDKNVTIKLYGSARNTYLLISNSDATFATIDQEISLNADSTITLSTSMLPDGAYFTFGKEILGPGYVNSNIVTWQRADDGVSGSDAWYDFSGNGNDATQSVVTDQPALLNGGSDTAINFNPGFAFKSTVEWFDFTSDLSMTGTGNKTVLWVARSMGATGTNQAILSHGAGGANMFVAMHDNTNRPLIGVGGGGSTCAPVSPSTVPFGTALIGAFNRTSATSATVYTNGGFPATSTCNSNFVSSNMRLGARSSAAYNPFNGNIAEMIVYDRSLPAAELQRVHSYLALKYGITLDQATPTDYVGTDWDGTTGTKYWTASKNTGYGNRIAGLGRDELTKLYQKQSRSAVADAIITIGAGTIATDNLTNTATIDDLSFFTWSDNNLGTAFTTPVSGVSNATHRMARVWKVDRTNWADQDITIDADKLGVRYLLVNATDATFGAGTVEYPINTTTGSVTINTADLPDGAYFTLATKIVGPGCVNNGILTWLRADYNGTPSKWSDFSGNQLDALQSTAANQPSLLTTSINFNPALNFDGVNDSLSLALNLNPPTTDPLTAFTVYNADVVSANNRALWGNDNGSWDRYMELDFVGGNNVNVAYTGGNIAGKPFINSTIMDDGVTNGSFVWINNGRVLNFTQSNSAGGLNTTTIGNWGNGGDFKGKIGEMVFYNRALDTTERLRVNSYLALKYGITLNQAVPTDYVASDWNGTTGTKMWDATVNTGYGFRITGIGRDDCDELHQKISRNQDGGLITVSIGSVLASSNAEIADSVITNNSYLVFGDNNLDTTWSVPLTATGITPTVRMPRIWKVDKTNWTDQSILIKYNKKNQNTFLLISADPTFATGVQEMAIDPNDSLVVFNSDQLPDGAYFTFAKEVYGPGYVNNGIQMWLRADDGTSTGSLWGDFSGNDNDAVQATAANQPVAVTTGINFNPAFDFDGTDDYLDVANNVGISNTNPFTIVGLGMRQTIGTWDAYVAQQGNVTNNLFFGYHSTNVPGVGATGTTASLGTTVMNANVPNFIGVTRTGNNFSFYANGKADGTVSAALTFTTANIRIGNRSNTADLAFDGYMGEVFVYNRTLNNTELQKVHSYLALKYGVTLNGGTTSYAATDWDGTTGTIYWDATANATYKNNIAGIGRDDNTKLLQKQSRSVNTAANGNMVAIGLGTIATTNAANTATFDDDMSYMVWGDDGTTGTKTGNLATAEVPASLDAFGCSKFTRLQREWKVQETGTVGSVQVQFYLTGGLVPNSATLSDFRLLIDDDGDFASGTTLVLQPSTYDAATQTLTFDNVDFVNGQYFTVVTDATNEAPGGVISNLYTWYRADKGVTTATGVSTWADQSTSLKNLTQATAGSQPVYNTTANMVNFNPSLTFDGTNDFMANAAISHTAATNGEDLFAVVLPNSQPSGFPVMVGMGTNASAQNETWFRFGQDRLQYLSRTNAVSWQSVANTATTPGIVQLANGNRSNTGSAQLLLNGTQVAAGTINLFPTQDYLAIGAARESGATSAYFSGRIAEVAIYNRQLTVTEREKIASYLAIKYGITLSHNYTYPNGTIVWDQAANTGYGNNITAIGRDDCNGLHQKQSKSVNTGAMITIGAGGEIGASNAANLNSLENNAALAFGDNNAAINAWTATESPAGRNRIAREWKMQLTGTIGTVMIQVPANTSAATSKLPAEINRMYMLVDADGDFSSGAQEVEMTLNGDNWELGYEFDAASPYFTFATGNNFLVLTSKVNLQGAWNGTAMRTDLKAASLLPATDPYGLNTTPSVAPNASAAQVVDWIKVELRDANDPATIVSSRAGFVLANGNIVDTNYISALAFYGVDAGSYYVAVRHRNHLGVMSFTASDFSAGTATLDFTGSSTDTWGSNARIDLGSGIMGLWAGNVNTDSSIRHSAKPSDASAVATAVLTHAGNTSADPAYTGFSNVYSAFDVNLDGKVYYTASPSDRAIIVNNVLSHPANTWGLSSFIITAQLP